MWKTADAAQVVADGKADDSGNVKDEVGRISTSPGPRVRAIGKKIGVILAEDRAAKL